MKNKMEVKKNDRENDRVLIECSTMYEGVRNSLTIPSLFKTMRESELAENFARVHNVIFDYGAKKADTKDQRYMWYLLCIDIMRNARTNQYVQTHMIGILEHLKSISRGC